MLLSSCCCRKADGRAGGGQPGGALLLGLLFQLPTLGPAWEDLATWLQVALPPRDRTAVQAAL